MTEMSMQDAFEVRRDRLIQSADVGIVMDMNDFAKFAALSPTAYADGGLGREQFIEMGIRQMWSPMPRIAGPAYTVSCPPGDNLMLHAAIYRAEPGSVIVVQAGDARYALSGGNVCATAQQRGIAGIVIDGVNRDVAEVREAALT